MKRIRILCVAFALSACNEAETASVTPAQSETMQTTRAYLLGTCPVSSRLGLTAPLAPDDILGGGTAQKESPSGLVAVAGALVEPLVDLAGDAVGSWLDERAKDQTTTTTVVANGSLLFPSVSTWTLPCIVVVQGTFDTTSDPLPVQPGVLALSPGATAADWDWPQPWLDLYRLRDKPRLYMELKLVPYPSYTAMRIEPSFVDLRRPAVDRGDGKPVHLALTASLSLRASSLGSTVVPLPTPVLGPTRLTPAQLIASASPWVALPRVVADPKSSGDGPALANGPLSVQVALVESVQPTMVDRVLAKTFGAVREPAADYLGRAVMTGLNLTGQGPAEGPPVETEPQ